jgi:hypothetical protein
MVCQINLVWCTKRFDVINLPASCQQGSALLSSSSCREEHNSNFLFMETDNSSLRSGADARCKCDLECITMLYYVCCIYIYIILTDVPVLQDIKSGTGIEDKELRRTLQSLACGKVRAISCF